MPAAGARFHCLVRVESEPLANRVASTAAATVMTAINVQHIAGPGPMVLDITGGGEDTVREPHHQG